MKPPRLLIVSYYFMPSTATSGRRPSRLARFLAESGVAPSVVTAAVDFYGGDVAPGPSIRDELTVYEVPHGSLCSQVARRGRAGRWAGKCAMVRGFQRAVGRALRSGPKPDFVLWRGVPFWYFPLAPHFRLLSGIPYVLDLGDVWYMRGIEYRRGQRSGLRHLIDAPAEAWAVRRAELVTLTTDEQTAIYRDRYGDRPGDGFMTMRWGYDARRLAGLTPAPKGRGLFRIGIFGRFSVYRRADADTLAAAVARLKVSRPVQVVHMGAAEPALASAFRRNGVLDCLQVRGMVAYGEGLSILASADCTVLSPLSDVSVPVKAYDYIGLNRPILAFAGRGTAVDSLLRRFPGAFIVQGADEAAAALHAMAEGGVTQLEAGLDPRKFSQQHQFELLVARLVEIMEKRRATSRCAC